MKNRFLFICILFLLPLICTACGKDKLSSAEVLRDSENVGGTLSFSYNSDLREIYFGGEGEEIQYYDEDISKGWLEGGCRVGIKMIAPSAVGQYETGLLSYAGTKQSAGDFYRLVNNQKIGEVVLYPLVDENHREVEIKVTWQDSAQEQTYKVIIAKGTKFMKKG